MMKISPYLRTGIPAVIFLFGWCSVAAQVAGADCWPLYRGNAQLTGNTPVVLQPPFKLLWTYKTGDAIKSSPVICGDMIYIGSNDGFLYALTTAGKLKWKFNAGTSVESPPLILRNTVYFGSLEGILFAVDSGSGKLKWKYKTDGQISGSANFITRHSGKQTCILVGSYDYNLHCVDAATGKGIWKYESGNYINGAPAVSGKLAIFGGCDGFLHLVGTDTGNRKTRWP